MFLFFATTILNLAVWSIYLWKVS